MYLERAIQAEVTARAEALRLVKPMGQATGEVTEELSLGVGRSSMTPGFLSE